MAASSPTGWSADGVAGEIDIDAICRFIGANSLGYLSLEGMLASIGFDASNSCTACWTGKYPTLIANAKAA